MKFVTGIVASLVIGSLSFGAFAAKEIQKDEVPMNCTQTVLLPPPERPLRWMQSAICRKADELGGTYFVVIAGEKNEKTVRA